MTVVRATQTVLEVLSSAYSKVRSTQEIVEVCFSISPNLNATQTVAEVLASRNVLARSSQVVAEVLTERQVLLRASQVVLEVLSPEANTSLRATQTLLEVIGNTVPSFRATQTAIEVISSVRALPFIRNRNTRFRFKMAKSIKIPIGVNYLGGTATITGDEQKRQLITVSLSDGDSANAFQQDVNLGHGMIFGQDSSQLRATVMRRLKSIFQAFEEDKIFRLMTETIAWSKGEEGELALTFSYIDIESDTVQSFHKAFTTGA